MSHYPVPSPLPLFDKSRSRATDPATSHEAEAFMRRSGKLNEQQRHALKWVRQIPGLTAREYQEVAVFAAEGEFRRRLPELVMMNLVRRGEARKCRVGLLKSLTWWPVEQKP